MKKKIKKIAITCLAVFLIGTITIPSMASSIKDAKSKKSSLEKEREDIEQMIQELEVEKGDIASYIEKLDKELNILHAKIDELNKNITQAEEDLTITKEELKVAKETEENQYITMKKRIKYMYENGNTDYIEVLLNSNDMSDLLNRTEYIEKISEYDGQMLERYQATKILVEEKQVEIEVSLEALKSLDAEVELEKVTVTKLIANKTKELDDYESKIDESEGIVDEYAEKIKKQDDLIEELIEEELRRAEEAARIAEQIAAEKAAQKAAQEAENAGNTGDTGNAGNDNSGNVATSGFMWPSAASTRITSSFGYRSQPTAGASTYHKGIDIGAPSGSNVLASASGTVTVATYQWAAGNYIMISHPNGISTVYMHNSKLLYSVGQSVNKGDVIALVGSTGASTGPHIHFGVRVNGEYVNPLNYVSP